MSEFVPANLLYDVETQSPIAHPAEQATDDQVRRAVESQEREVRADGGTCSNDTERFEFGLWGLAPDRWVTTDSPGSYRLVDAEIVGEPGSEMIVVEVERQHETDTNSDGGESA